MPPLPEVEGYSQLEPLARGGFGVIYRAHQDRFDRVVALKVLSVVDLTDRDRARFDRECRAMGKLSWHPNVVAVLDSGVTADGHPYLAMEFVPGGSLAERLKDGPMAWPDVVEAGIQVAGALGAAHAAGTLHRDLKPENLLLGPFGEVELADFGIAAVEGKGGTTTGLATYTVAHVAPEILEGRHPDERSDVYGLASTLHTLATGASPYSGGDGEPIAALITRVLQAPPPRLDDVPADLADLLVSGLAKDPDERPQTAAAFGERLQAVQTAAGRPVTPLRLAPVTSGRARGPEGEVDPDADTAPVTGEATVVTGGAPQTPVPRLPQEPAATPTEEAARTGEPTPAAGDENRSSSSPPTVITPAVGATPVPSLPDGAGTPAAGEEVPPADPSAGPAPTPAPPPASPPAPSRPAAAASVTAEEARPRSGTTAPAPPTTAPRGPDRPASARPPARRGRWAPLAIGVAVVVVALVAGGLAIRAVRGGDDSGGGATGGSDLDPVATDLPVDPNPTGVAADDTAVWVAHSADPGTMSRLDPGTDAVAATVAFGTEPRGVAVGAGSVWVAGFTDGTLLRVDPATDTVVATIAIGGSPRNVAATDDAVWLTDNTGGLAVRVDPATETTVAAVEVGQGPFKVDADASMVWVTNNGDDTVTRIDPATNQVVATVPVGGAPQGVLIAGGSVWVSNVDDGTVTKIDPETDEVVDTFEVGSEPSGLAFEAGVLWVARTGDGSVSALDPGTGEILATVPAGDRPTGLAAGAGALWVTNTSSASVTRIDPTG